MAAHQIWLLLRRSKSRLERHHHSQPHQGQLDPRLQETRDRTRLGTPGETKRVIAKLPTAKAEIAALCPPKAPQIRQLHDVIDWAQATLEQYRPR